jgi:hypothetical protein
VFPELLSDTGPNYKCARCGAAERETGGAVPPDIAPFIRGQIVVNVRTMGVCHQCFLIVCSGCAIRGRCPACGGMLFAPDFLPDRPSWLHPIKLMKWLRLFKAR